MMLSHSFSRLITGGVVGLCLAFSFPVIALEKVTFQLDWLPGGDKAPIYVGIENGYFSEQGIDIKIAPGRGSSEAITKLATGSSDIGTVGLGALMSAKAQQNVPATAVYSMFTKPPHAFLTTKESGITSIKDLKGKRIATSPFTSSNVFLPLILAENGLAMSDIRLMQAEPGALGPMLAMGRTDAVIEWVTNSPRHQPLLEKTKKSLQVLPWAEAGMDIYATSVVAGDHFLEQRPDVAKRFLKAYAKAIHFTQNNHGEAAAIVHKHVKEVPADVAEQSIRHFTFLSNNEIVEEEGLGHFDATRLRDTWRWVSEAQNLNFDEFDPESAVSRHYVQ